MLVAPTLVIFMTAKKSPACEGFRESRAKSNVISNSIITSDGQRIVKLKQKLARSKNIDDNEDNRKFIVVKINTAMLVLSIVENIFVL